MRIKKGHWYAGKIGNNTVHRYVEEIAVKMAYGPIPGAIIVMYENEKSKTKGTMNKEKFENWAKEDVTHVYVGTNSEGVTE